MKTHKFARKTFYVDAVRVSEANIEEVAEWCKGKIDTDETGHQFLSVEVHRPLNDRQTQAFIGDWVLFAGSGYKVYTPKAFDKSFEKVKFLTKAQADEAGITVPHEPRPKNEQKKPVHGNKEQGIKPVPQPPKNKRVGDVGKALKEAQAKLEGGPTAKKEQDVDYRSAKTGQYVSEAVAEANPDTTVAEVEDDKTVTSTGKVIDTDANVVAEVDVPIRKSAADLEAERLIAEVKALEEQ